MLKMKGAEVMSLSHLIPRNPLTSEQDPNSQADFPPLHPLTVLSPLAVVDTLYILGNSPLEEVDCDSYM